MTTDQAFQMMFLTRRVTTDFAAAGKYAKIANQVIPFFNAVAQGARTFGRTFQTKPLAASFWALSTFTVPTLLLWWKNKDKEWYKDMPWRDKFAYWNIEVDGEIIRIPRPFEWGNAFAVIPEAIWDATYKQNPKVMKEAVGYLFESTAPDILPHVLQVAKEQGFNKVDYNKKPIVPKSQLDKPLEEQFGPYSTRLSKFLGETFHWSPYRIDHVIYNTFGGLGPDVLDILQLGRRSSTRAFEPSDTPVFGRLFKWGGVEGGNSQTMNDYYDMLMKWRSEYASMDPARKEAAAAVVGPMEEAYRSIRILNQAMAQADTRDKRARVIKEAKAYARDAMLEANKNAANQWESQKYNAKTRLERNANWENRLKFKAWYDGLEPKQRQEFAKYYGQQFVPDFKKLINSTKDQMSTFKERIKAATKNQDLNAGDRERKIAEITADMKNFMEAMKK